MTASSKLFTGVVAEETCSVVQQLFDAGAILVGQASGDELAFGVLGKNVSQKVSVMISLALLCFGCLIFSASGSINMACVGLFFIGAGNIAQVRLGVSIISEITEKKLASKFIATLLGGTTLGALLCTFAFWMLKHWRYVGYYFMLIPSIIILLVTFFLLQETPKFLIKSRNSEKILSAL